MIESGGQLLCTGLRETEDEAMAFETTEYEDTLFDISIYIIFSQLVTAFSPI